MRRQKLEVKEQNEISAVLHAAEWGVLGISRPGEAPVLVPLNFVANGQTIYFHGALAGQKMEVAQSEPQVSFVVVQAYSQLPSYYFDERAACPATQLYKSVISYGRLRLVEDDAEKASALQLLMEKLQPEGGYEPITPTSELYVGRLKGVAVIAFDIDDLSAKFKLGQDQKPEWRASIGEKLSTRGCPIDHATVSEMRRLACQ